MPRRQFRKAVEAQVRGTRGLGNMTPWMERREARPLVYITCRLDTKHGQDLCVVEGTIWTEKRQ